MKLKTFINTEIKVIFESKDKLNKLKKQITKKDLEILDYYFLSTLSAKETEDAFVIGYEKTIKKYNISKQDLERILKNDMELNKLAASSL